MNHLSPQARLRRVDFCRTRRTAALLTGAFLTGTLLNVAGAARAQVFSTTIVAPTQTQVFQFSTTTTTASPTYNRVGIADGLNVYTTASAASSTIGAAVTYATSSSYVPTTAGSYTVKTSATGFDSGNYIQYIYSPSLVPTTAATSLKGVQYGYFPDNATNSGSYNVNLTAATAYQFVDAGYYSNNATYPQVPGNGYYSEGTATTTVLLNNPGSTSTIPDAPTVPNGQPKVLGTAATQTLNVASTSNIFAFNSITIDGLNHTVLGDLVATLSHNGVSVDLFDHTGASLNPSDPKNNYDLGSQAQFGGGNYTFALTGADLSAFADGTTVDSSKVLAASGNAAGGFDSANAGKTLNSFLGQSVFGAWTLSIRDGQEDDTGSFTGFSFGINNNASAPVPETSTSIGFGLLLLLAAAGQTLSVRRRRAAAAA